MTQSGDMHQNFMIKLNKFLKKYESSRVGMLTNQSAYTSSRGYHFEFLSSRLSLKTLFMPEHGLFAELQDQISGSGLTYSYQNIKIQNLYGDSESSLIVPRHALEELDLILIDIRDVGARYYTFLTSAYYLLLEVHKFNLTNSSKSLAVVVIDSPNPIGRNVEGSPLESQYESFVGVSGMVHRHGLTPAELLQYYISTKSLEIPFEALPIGEIYDFKDSSLLWIPPSPNIPSANTCFVYPGQCLLEGTNLSEGRGTTKPFEIFGAPFIDIQDKLLLSLLNQPKDSSYLIRPLFFQPTFHKHSGIRCGGFQIMVLDKKEFHSLLFSLHFIKTIQDYYPDQFAYLQGAYEFRSDKAAIELLLGDTFLLGYLSGKNSYKQVREYLKTTEKQWKRERKEYFLYH
jgi:uncharacterized protein YbbC (DUF1343 family)